MVPKSGPSATDVRAPAAGVWSRALGRPEGAGPKEAPMSTTTTEVTPFPAGSIVVGVDGSPSGSEAVAWAAVQAAHDHRPLVLVCAYHLDSLYWLGSAGIDDGAMIEEMRAEASRLLDAAKAVRARDRTGARGARGALPVRRPRRPGRGRADRLDGRARVPRSRSGGEPAAGLGRRGRGQPRDLPRRRTPSRGRPATPRCPGRDRPHRRLAAGAGVRLRAGLEPASPA